MSINVRNTFAYKNKYFDNNDSEEQQLTDYIMHEFSLKSDFNLNGGWSLVIATNIVNALNSSSLFNATATATVSEETDNTENPPGTYRKITITTP